MINFVLGKGAAGAHLGAGAGVSGEQVDAQDREAGDRNIHQTKHTRSTQKRKGATWEHPRTGTRRYISIF